MAGRWNDALRGCAIGCGVLCIGTALLVVAGTISLMNPFRHALDDRIALEQRFGSPDDYRPSPDGSVAAARMETFLSVRHALAPLCREFEDTAAVVRRLEALDEQQDVTRADAIRQAWQVTRRMMGMGSRIGRFFETRNQTLVDAGMGLGEYTYMYVIAYHDQLVHSAADITLFEDRPVNARIGADLRAMLHGQLVELEAMQGPCESVDALRAEVGRLDQNPDRLPWQDGLPAPIEESVRPYRDELDATFCPSIAELELRHNTRRGLAIETE